MHDSGAERALTADLAHELDVGVRSAVRTVGALTRHRLALLDDAGCRRPQSAGRNGEPGADTSGLFGARPTGDDRRSRGRCHRAGGRPGGPSSTGTTLTAYEGGGCSTSRLTPLRRWRCSRTSVPSAIDRAAADRPGRSSGIPVLEGTRSGLLCASTTWPAHGAAAARPPRSSLGLDTARRDRWQVSAG